MKNKTLLIIGIFLLIFVFFTVSCSSQEAIHTTLDFASDDARVIIRGETDAGDFVTPIIDEVTHGLLVEDLEHFKIHSGETFLIHYNDDGVDANVCIDVTLTTPDTTEWLHASWDVYGTAATHIFIYEGATVDVEGADLVPVNLDRNSPDTTDAICRIGDNFTDTGGLVWAWHIGEKGIAGDAGALGEYVLKQGTVYLFRTCSEINGNEISAQIAWYEHINIGR